MKTDVPRVPRAFLLLTALVTGAVVMALEILGSRLLAPVFGNSLFVWGALIGVILAAMSSGYAFGGWFSDRHRSAGVLAGLLLFSGAWTYLVAWVSQPVLFQLEKVIEDPRWGPCLAATVLLAPPAFGLSGVLPAMLRLAVADMDHLGRHTGRMIALSTVGSLLGTWGTAFFLLSWVGSQALVAWLATVQVVLGLAWLWAAKPARAAFALLSGVVISAGLMVLGSHPIQKLQPPVYQEDSPYQQVRIRDDQLFRYLVLDRTFHAVMWKSDPITLFLPYSQLMVAALALTQEPTRGLILGHGGGSLAKWLAQVHPDLELDVVEFDPVVVRMAEEYFNYSPPANHHVVVKDGRAFLRRTSNMYDVIWIDAFARHMIPFHLTTAEFFQLVRDRLKPKGVVAVNLASSGEGGDEARAQAVVQTMRQAFPKLETYGVKGPWKSGPTKAENLIFLGGYPVERGNAEQIAAQVAEAARNGKLPMEAVALLATHRSDAWPAGTVLTDDFAPYDLLIGREATPTPVD